MKQKPQTVKEAISAILPKIGWIKERKAPWQGAPIVLPNKPAMLEPTDQRDKVVLLRKGEVVAELVAPEVNDYNGWQAAMLLLRQRKAIPGK